MPAQIFGAPAAAVELYIAFYGQAPSNPIYNNLIGVAGASNVFNLALTIGNQFSTVSDAALATQVLTNIGITSSTIPAASYTALQTALTSAFAAYPTQRGIVVLNALNLLTQLETDATFGTVAQTFNQAVTNSYVYASNTANTQTQTVGNIATTQPLTVNAGDIVNGTTGNDNINGNLFFNTPSGTFFQTLNTGDAVNGGTGTDTLNLGFNAGAAQNINATLTSIENLSINTTGAGATTLDMTNSTGLSTVTVANGTAGGDVTLANLGTALTTVNLNSTGAGLTVTSTAAAVAGTADAVAVNLSQAVTTAGAAIPLSLAGYETINIASNGPATNMLLVQGYSSSASFKVTGTQSVSLATGTSTNAVTIDASGMTGTGALTVVADTAANNVNVTGSANGDTVTLNGSYTTSDTVNGGAGNDTLNMVSAVVTATQANQSNLSNLEILRVTDALAAGTTVTPASWGGATTLSLVNGTAGAFTVNFAAGTDTLNLGGVITGGAGIINATGSSTSDVLNITAGTATSGNLTFNTLTDNGFETINLTSNGALGSTNTITTLTMTGSASQEVLNISGARNITFTNTITADQVNASALTGSLAMGAASTSASVPASGLQITGGSAADTLWGATGADVINGGAGNDMIRLAADGTANQADILTGGAGNDTFQFRGATVAALSAMSTTDATGTQQIVRITDFVAGSDKIGLVVTGGAYTGVTMNTALTVATANDLNTVGAAAAGLAASAAAGVAQAVLITVSAGTAAGTYLLVNDATAGWNAAADLLINISGVTGTITASDFTFA